MGETALDLVVAVRRLASSIRSTAFHQLAEYDLAPMHGAALRAIQSHQPCTPAFVADACDIERPNMTGVLARLEAQLLITRTKSVVDGRVWLLELTPTGTKLMPKINAIWDDIAATVTHGVPAAAQREMLSAVTAADARLRESL